MLSDLSEIKDKKIRNLIEYNENKLLEDINNPDKTYIVFMVGAGISKAYGLPTWDELTNNFIENILKNEIIEKDKKRLSAIRKLLKRENIKEKFTISKEILKKINNKNDLSDEKYYNFLRDEVHFNKEEENFKKSNIYEILRKISDKKGYNKLKFITTNIDTFLEKSLKIPQKDIMVGLDNENIGKAENIKLFKIHGDISKINSSYKECRLVFTPKEYIELYSDKVKLKILSNILEKSVLIFIGKEIEEEFGYFLSQLENKKNNENRKNNENKKNNYDKSFYIIKGYKSENSNKKIRANDIYLDNNYYEHFDFKFLPILNFEYLSKYLDKLVLNNIYKLSDLKLLDINRLIEKMNFKQKKEIKILLERISKENFYKEELTPKNKNKLKDNIKLLKNICLKDKDSFNENFIGLLNICNLVEDTKEFWKIKNQLGIFQLEQLLKVEKNIDKEKLSFILKHLNRFLKEKRDSSEREFEVYLLNRVLRVLLEKVEKSQLEEFFTKLAKIKLPNEDEKYLVYTLYIKYFFNILGIEKNISRIIQILKEELVENKIYIYWSGEEKKPTFSNKKVLDLLYKIKDIFIIKENFSLFLLKIKKEKYITKHNKDCILGYFIYKNIELYKEISPSEFIKIFKHWGRDLYRSFNIGRKEELKEYLKNYSYKNKFSENYSYELFLLGDLLDNEEIKNKYKSYSLPTDEDIKVRITRETKEKIQKLLLQENVKIKDIKEVLNISFLVDIKEITYEVYKLYIKYNKEFLEIIDDLNDTILEELFITFFEDEEVKKVINYIIEKRISIVHKFYLKRYIIETYEKNDKEKLIKNILLELIKNFNLVLSKDEEENIFEDTKGVGIVDIIYKFIFNEYLKIKDEEEFFEKIKLVSKQTKKTYQYYLGYYYQKLIEKDKTMMKEVKENLSREFIIGLFHTEYIDKNSMKLLLDKEEFILEFNKHNFKNIVIERMMIILGNFYFYGNKKEKKYIFKFHMTEKFIENILDYNLDFSDEEIREKASYLLKKIVEENKAALLNEISLEQFIKYFSNNIFNILEENDITEIIDNIWERNKKCYLSEEELKEIFEEIIKNKKDEEKVFCILLFLKGIDEFFIDDFQKVLLELGIKEIKFERVQYLSNKLNSKIIGILENKEDILKIENLKILQKSMEK